MDRTSLPKMEQPCGDRELWCHQRRYLYATKPPSPGLPLTFDFPEAPTPFPVPSLGWFGKTETAKEVIEFASSS